MLQVLKADYSTALMSLLRYPPPSNEHPPITFLTDAMYLKSNLSISGGSHIISKYSGKTPMLRPYIQPQRSITPPPKTRTQPSSPISPRSMGVSMPSLNLEGLVQDVAKNMFERSEKWGVNRALREAMGEVRRVSQGVGDQQREIYTKWKEGEDRRKVLGGLLEVSLSILDEMVENISMPAGDSDALEDNERKREAVARVRYVQNCLLDGNIEIDQRWLGSLANSRRTSFQGERKRESEPALPDTSSLAAALAASKTSSATSSTSNTRSSSPYRTLPTRKPPPFPTYAPSAIQSDSGPQTAKGVVLSPTTPAVASPSSNISSLTSPVSSSMHPSRNTISASTKKPPPYNRSATQTRRSLAQSEFSWMLGDDTAHRNRSAFVSDGEKGGRKSSEIFGDGRSLNDDKTSIDMGFLGRKN